MPFRSCTEINLAFVRDHEMITWNDRFFASLRARRWWDLFIADDSLNSFLYKSALIPRLTDMSPTWPQLNTSSYKKGWRERGRRHGDRFVECRHGDSRSITRSDTYAERASATVSRIRRRSIGQVLDTPFGREWRLASHVKRPFFFRTMETHPDCRWQSPRPRSFAAHELSKTGHVRAVFPLLGVLPIYPWVTIYSADGCTAYAISAHVRASGTCRIGSWNLWRKRNDTRVCRTNFEAFRQTRRALVELFRPCRLEDILIIFIHLTFIIRMCGRKMISQRIAIGRKSNDTSSTQFR
jgi:hypothetical protein